MSPAHACLRTIAIVAVLAIAPVTADAYSVLAHQAAVDSVWEPGIAPLLRARFSAGPSELRRARAFAYGGSVIQDLGYYPFGARLFTDLTHYVRSGDFVEALIHEARTADEYAFALGALAHYNADTAGHAIAVNRAVALMYPKLRARYGDEVTYAESPKRHVMVEFAFDVVHAAAQAYLPDTYHAFIGFEVSTDLLARAFRATYGLEVRDLFMDFDLAVGTYRYAIATVIPEVTRVAWREKREAIARLAPDVRRDAFIYSLTRREYEKRFGTRYRRAGLLTRCLTFLFKLLPKVGPLRPFAFETPTAEAERLFAESFVAVRTRYQTMLMVLKSGRRLDLQNTDFDTGASSRFGDYVMADTTYAKLLDTFDSRGFARMPSALRRDVERFYATFGGRRHDATNAPKKVRKVAEQLATLRGTR